MSLTAADLALAAWKLLGKPIEFPALNIACSGTAISSTRDEWMSLLQEGSDPQVRFFFGELHPLFAKGPVLGSLINPRLLAEGWLSAKGMDNLLQSLGAAAASGTPERHELGIAAQGLAKAAEELAGRYTLVITNVPYLEQRKHGAELRAHCAESYSASKGDLATVFISRCLELCQAGGGLAVVSPQNWLFGVTFRHFRERLLSRYECGLISVLGPGAFETISGEVVTPVLTIVRNHEPSDLSSVRNVDVVSSKTPVQKGAGLVRGAIRAELQTALAQNPDCRIVFGMKSSPIQLGDVALCLAGIMNGDSPRFLRHFWEIGSPDRLWAYQQTTVPEQRDFGGFCNLVFFDEVAGHLREEKSVRREKLHNSDQRGNQVWGRRGVAVSSMGSLPVSLYLGDKFDSNVAAVVPKDEAMLGAIWAFCKSSDFHDLVRKIDPKMKVTNATFAALPFDQERWSAASADVTLPEAESADPTEYLFHGYPAVSSEALQVAVVRLLGYRWPAEHDPRISLSPRANALIRQCTELSGFVDNDGLVCIPSVRGEKPAADRLLAITSACGLKPNRDLDHWLRNEFFAEHCRLFDHLPFIWHIWDGRPDGFHALVNYHKLAGPNGGGRRTLETLTYSYLGDWIERQKADQRDGKDGADGRLAAAQDLQAQLERILTGEQPYDIFVRWKPLHEQPVGWDPDINDGVRINIRPFMSVELRKGGRAGAGILRWKPNITWKKDRGTESKIIRPIKEFPWFWGCPGEGSLDERTNFKGGGEFDGSRWNDLHYDLGVKRAAREEQKKSGGR